MRPSTRPRVPPYLDDGVSGPLTRQGTAPAAGGLGDPVGSRKPLYRKAAPDEVRERGTHLGQRWHPQRAAVRERGDATGYANAATAHRLQRAVAPAVGASKPQRARCATTKARRPAPDGTRPRTLPCIALLPTLPNRPYRGPGCANGDPGKNGDPDTESGTQANRGPRPQNRGPRHRIGDPDTESGTPRGNRDQIRPDIRNPPKCQKMSENVRTCQNMSEFMTFSELSENANAPSCSSRMGGVQKTSENVRNSDIF